MPPGRFHSQSLDMETVKQLDKFRRRHPAYRSRAEILRHAVDEFVKRHDAEEAGT